MDTWMSRAERGVDPLQNPWRSVWGTYCRLGGHSGDGGSSC